MRGRSVPAIAPSCTGSDSRLGRAVHERREGHRVRYRHGGSGSGCARSASAAGSGPGCDSRQSTHRTAVSPRGSWFVVEGPAYLTGPSSSPGRSSGMSRMGSRVYRGLSGGGAALGTMSPARSPLRSSVDSARPRVCTMRRAQSRMDRASTSDAAVLLISSHTRLNCSALIVGRLTGCAIVRSSWENGGQMRASAQLLSRLARRHRRRCGGRQPAALAMTRSISSRSKARRVVERTLPTPPS